MFVNRNLGATGVRAGFNKANKELHRFNRSDGVNEINFA